MGSDGSNSDREILDEVFRREIEPGGEASLGNPLPDEEDTEPLAYPADRYVLRSFDSTGDTLIETFSSEVGAGDVASNVAKETTARRDGGALHSFDGDDDASIQHLCSANGHEDVDLTIFVAENIQRDRTLSETAKQLRTEVPEQFAKLADDDIAAILQVGAAQQIAPRLNAENQSDSSGQSQSASSCRSTPPSKDHGLLTTNTNPIGVESAIPKKKARRGPYFGNLRNAFATTREGGRCEREYFKMNVTQLKQGAKISPFLQREIPVGVLSDPGSNHRVERDDWVSLDHTPERELVGDPSAVRTPKHPSWMNPSDAHLDQVDRPYDESPPEKQQCFESDDDEGGRKLPPHNL